MSNASLVLCILGLLGSSCALGSPPSGGSDSGVALSSQTVPLAETIPTAVEPASDEPVVADSGEGAPPSEDRDAPTELSTDPDITYAPNTCYEPSAEGETATEVDCTRPHTVEVYAVRDLPGGAGASFLGLEAAIELCDEDFTRLTGVGIGLATTMRRSVLRPSEETWGDGEREVTCFVVFPAATTSRLADTDPLRSFGLVSLYGMDAGDCFSDFAADRTAFASVSCDEPHNAEVFVDVELPDGQFPGDVALEESANQFCFGNNFEKFVGVAYEASVISSLRSRPSEETWQAGDRTINCILTEGGVVTESFRGSKL